MIIEAHFKFGAKAVRDLVQKKSVIELGSGTGFLGVIIAELQISAAERSDPPSLTLTDISPEVLNRCQENVQLPCSKISLISFITARLMTLIRCLCATSTTIHPIS
jgi:methylase of polypeptide subunit release factors